MFHETRSDAKTLLKRQRDIDIGKNTVGYGRYLASIARYVQWLFLFLIYWVVKLQKCTRSVAASRNTQQASRL